MLSVQGRVDEATKRLIEQAEVRFGTTESACVRMALEKFMPGFLNGGRSECSVELGALLTEAVGAAGIDPVREALAELIAGKPAGKKVPA